MVYVYAAFSVLAAGFLFRSDWANLTSVGSTESDSARWQWIALRLIALGAMVVCGFEATALFGEAGSGTAFMKQVAVLWLPQLVIALLFADSNGNPMAGDRDSSRRN